MNADGRCCAVAGCEREAPGGQFDPLGRFCSSHRYWRPVDHPERECIGCDESFKPRRSDQVYCSRRCRHRQQAHRSYVPRPKVPPRRRALTCAVCCVTYLGVWGRYCSAACTNKAWKQRHRDEYLAGKKRYTLRRSMRARH